MTPVDQTALYTALYARKSKFYNLLRGLTQADIETINFDDIFQDAILYTLENERWKNYDASRAGIDTWFLRALYHVISLYVRSLAYRTDAEFEGTLNDQTGNDTTEDLATRIDVDAALGLLTDEQRTLITDHYYMGATQGELARERGISQQAVSSQIQTGLRSLYAVLK